MERRAHRGNGTDGGAFSSVPFISFEDAQVVRNGRPILTIDRLDIAECEHVAILGPNGSGKSTFVKLVTREVLPLYRARPPVRLRGNARPTLSQVRSMLGVVSASMQSEITAHIPVGDIVAGGMTSTLGLPPHVGPSTAARARDAAREPLDLLGIGDLADRDVMTLSTGQARRVLIARALVGDPAALVLDEPCTGLDPEGMFYVRRSMREIARSGKLVILVTHYPEDVVPEIGRVLLMKGGRVFADGPKGALLTDGVVSSLFGIPVGITCTEGYYSLVSAY